jgi:hypothetical protein
MTSKIKAAAIIFAAVLIVAGAAVYLYPRLVKQSPALSAGTSFLSSGTISSSVGGNWHRQYYITAGAHNPIAFVRAYFGMLMPNYTQSGSPLPANETQYLSGNSQFSIIGYSEQTTGANIVGALLYLPNVTLATGIYANLTAKLHNNVSVQVSTGTIGSAPYTFANLTYNGNVTEGIFTHNGNYFLAFVYVGTTGVSKSSLVNVMTEEVHSLGTGTTVSYPSRLVTSSQAGSALSIGIDSTIYFSANVTNMSSVIRAFSGISGNTSVTGAGANTVGDQYLGNLTGAGATVFGNVSQHEIALSSFATFKSSTYSSSLYEALNTQFDNSNYSSSYHSGVVSGKQYFFVNASVSNGSSAQISLLVCVDGNSLIVQAVLSPGAMTYTQMTAFAAAQISDI